MLEIQIILFLFSASISALSISLFFARKKIQSLPPDSSLGSILFSVIPVWVFIYSVFSFAPGAFVEDDFWEFGMGAWYVLTLPFFFVLSMFLARFYLKRIQTQSFFTIQRLKAAAALITFVYVGFSIYYVAFDNTNDPLGLDGVIVQVDVLPGERFEVNRSYSFGGGYNWSANNANASLYLRMSEFAKLPIENNVEWFLIPIEIRVRQGTSLESIIKNFTYIGLFSREKGNNSELRSAVQLNQDSEGEVMVKGIMIGTENIIVDWYDWVINKYSKSYKTIIRRMGEKLEILKTDFLGTEQQPEYTQKSATSSATSAVKQPLRLRVFEDTNMRIKVAIPESYRNSTNFENESWSATFTSPNFSSGQELPTFIPVTGMQIMIVNSPLEGRLNKSIWSQEAYLSFQEKYISDCSNCVETKRIFLDGEQAYYIRVKYSADIGTFPESHGVSIKLIHNLREFNISFLFDNWTTENQSIIATFIESFEFTR